MYDNDDQVRVYQNHKYHEFGERGCCAWAWPYQSHGEKAFYKIRQSDYTEMMSKEGFTRIVNSMIHGAGIVSGHGHISHTGKVYLNCKFHNPQGRGLCARAWPHYWQSYGENA